MQPAFPKYMLAVFAVIFLLTNTLFVVDETEQAIVLRFGKPRAVIQEAGLKFKLPAPFETLVVYEKRILEVDPPAETVNILSDRMIDLTNEATAENEAQQKAGNAPLTSVAMPAQSQGMPILVDTFARYRITNSLKFLQRLRTEQNANIRISNVMNDATRDVLGQTTLNDLLSSDRSKLMNRIKKLVNEALSEQGVEMVDVRIVRADLTSDLRAFTVNRMISQQKERATKTRSVGQEKAIQIRSDAERERSILLAQAQQKAQGLRGEGDKEAIKIYADAFNTDPEFYRFLRTMESYKQTFGGDTQFILSPNGDYLKYLKSR